MDRMDELAVLLAVLDTGSLAEAGRRRSAAGHEPGHRGAGATCRRAADRADDLAAHGTPATPADLAGHATIVSVSRGGLLEWRFRDGERERVARLTPRLMVNDVEAMLLAARSGHAWRARCRIRWPGNWKPARWCDCCRRSSRRLNRCASCSSATG